jgi:hypothetical protein
MPTEEYRQQIVAMTEFDIRQWFTLVAMEQAEDTARAIGVIMETRRSLEPKRKRRKDAGQPRTEQIKLTEAK